jgi:predicted dehydrogenase
VTADDDVALLLRFASGARCTVDLSGLARPGHLLLEVYGSEGALAIEEDERLLTATGKDGWTPAEIPDRMDRKVGGDARLGPFVELADRLVTPVRGGETPDFADFRQGLRVQAVMEVAQLSADEGRIVRVETPTV